MPSQALQDCFSASVEGKVSSWRLAQEEPASADSEPEEASLCDSKDPKGPTYPNIGDVQLLYYRSCNYDFGQIACIWVPGPLGTEELTIIRASF